MDYAFCLGTWTFVKNSSYEMRSTQWQQCEVVEYTREFCSVFYKKRSRKYPLGFLTYPLDSYFILYLEPIRSLVPSTIWVSKMEIDLKIGYVQGGLEGRLLGNEISTAEKSHSSYPMGQL